MTGEPNLGDPGPSLSSSKGLDSETLESALAPRRAVIDRKTTETRIDIRLTIEGKGQYKVSTGIRFFDHMLELFTRHGAFDLELKCEGDLVFGVD